MLVITRSKGKERNALILTTESGERIRVVLVEIGWGRVRLGIDAPKTVRIWREELEQKEKPC